MFAVATVTALSLAGPGGAARAEPPQPDAAQPDARPTPAEDHTSVTEPEVELAEAPPEDAPSDGGQETVAAVVIEDGERSVITVEAAPSEVAEVKNELAERPGVVDVFVDAPARAAALPDDTRVAEQWSLRELGLDQQGVDWANHSAGAGETVAVLDSGVDDTHPDLTGRVLCADGADFTVPPAQDGDPYVTSGNGCTDSFGHGTHVAGIVGADWNNGEGIAGVSQARILPVRVLDDEGWGTVAGISAGIHHAVDAGASVINMSIVGDDSGYEEAIQYALTNDVVVVASAGNNRQRGNLPQYPAATPGVFSVAATDWYGLSAEYSYRGATNFISAPGTGILSTLPGSEPDSQYGELSGTSMAAPHVAGIVAWYRELHPTATVDEIRAEIQRTAVNMEKAGRDPSTGYGMIDMAELLTETQVVPDSWYEVTLPAAPLVTSALPRDSGLFVTWDPPAWNGGASIKRYGVHVYRYTVVSGIPQYDYVTTAEAPNTATSLIVPGLVNGYAYSVVAYARNTLIDEEGQWSEVTPPTRIFVPKITSVTAAPETARATWTAPTNVDGSPVGRYIVDVYAGSTRVKHVAVSKDTREYRATGLVNGRAYTFLVWAEGTQGTRIPSKRSVAVTPRDVPGAPRIGTPAAADDAARVYWSAPSDTGGSPITTYVVKVYSGTRGITSVTVSGTARSVLVTGLANRASYNFTVTAKNAVGLGPASTRSVAVRTT